MPYGWQDNGEYHCPCGTIFGKNLRGESPVALVTPFQHTGTCVPHALTRLRSGHPFAPCPPYMNRATWERAIREHLNPGAPATFPTYEELQARTEGSRGLFLEEG